MAKEEKKILTPEEKKREKELLEQEKAEKAAIDKMQKEKEKRRKLKEKRIKQEKKQEIKRIKTLINLPYKLLLHISLLVTMFATIILFFWVELDIKTTLIYLFFIFTFFYFGIGSVMAAVIYMISEDKKREMLEARRLEAEKLQDEEQKRLDEEAEKLQEIERDIAEKKNDTIKNKELLTEQNAINKDDSSIDFIDENGQMGPLMLGETADSLSDEFQQSFDEPNIDEFIEQEMAEMGSDSPKSINAESSQTEDTIANQLISEEVPEEQLSYFDEIKSPDYDPNMNK